MISHHRKFIFLHIPKCGGTSIEASFSAWTNIYAQNYFFIGKNRQHFFLNQILDKYPECSNYFKFAFIRNPFSRIVSEYKYAKKESNNNHNTKSKMPLNLSFQEFCQNLDYSLDHYCYKFHNKSLCDYLLNPDGSKTVDFIGRLESFQKDFDIICDKIGIQQKKLPHSFKSDYKKHYTEYYDDKTREIVAKKYAKDIELFDYKFGE
tara:strand:- start:3779 stop:4396 length:618 start_codon:yes stop_codon:yes gene_type:complete